MALFEKLFGKRDCEICGGDMGLLGNYKLADGDLCKKCAENISPIMSVTKSHTVAQIKEQLAYREENEKLLEEFNPTEEFGYDEKLFFDFEMGRFAYSHSGDWKGDKADLIPFEKVTAVETDVEEDEMSLDEDDSNSGEASTVKVYYYSVTLTIDSPWFDELEVDLTNGDAPSEKEEEKLEMYREQQARIKEILEKFVKN